MPDPTTANQQIEELTEQLRLEESQHKEEADWLRAKIEELTRERESSERHFTIALRAAQKAQDAAEAERDAASREMARVQEAGCCCAPTEEGSVWHRDCPLHGADAHRRALAAEAQRDTLREALEEIAHRDRGPDNPHAYFPADIQKMKAAAERADLDVSWGRIEYRLREVEKVARLLLTTPPAKEEG